jgi:hypothetical protein
MGFRGMRWYLIVEFYLEKLLLGVTQVGQARLA